VASGLQWSRAFQPSRRWSLTNYGARPMSSPALRTAIKDRPLSVRPVNAVTTPQEAQLPGKLQNIGMALACMARFGDFQAEYTPAAISNGSHQRMSVSVFASPRNQPKNR
jgi:hypothetical protein